MSRRAAIIEEFDDDTDLPLPSRPLQNLGARGALLEEIDGDSDEDGSEEDDEGDDINASVPSSRSAAAGPASPSQLGVSQQKDGPPTVSDITPYKNWTCIYPIYIDAKRSYGTGSRRIPRTKAVWWPLSKDIADATSRLGLSTLHEVQKCHPQDWENPGRVRVQWKKDGRLVNSRIKTKKQLLEMIAFHIQSVKPELIPKPPFSVATNAVGHSAPASGRTPSKLAGGKGKQLAKSKAPPSAKLHQTAVSKLPSPPEPLPPIASRLSPYSPALVSGVLIETLKAGMSTPDVAGGAPGQIGGAGAPGGKGKRKVVRVRG